MTPLRLTALLALVVASSAAPERQLNLRQLQESSDSDSGDTESNFFCVCECDGDGTAGIWIADTNADYDPDAPDFGEDEEGTKYSWACERDDKVFDYLYDNTDVFCANDCQEDGVEDEDGDYEVVETDDEFYEERDETEEDEGDY